MKAMVLKELKQDLVYCDYPDPVIESDDDVIIRVRACGVCATDIKVIDGYISSEGLPRIPGHEPAGDVCAVGAGVSNIKIGDRVISSINVTCKTCIFCRGGREKLCKNTRGRIGITMDGGFAEYMKTKEANLVKIPDNVPYAQAAVLPCAGGVPYHALLGRIQLTPIDKVLVLGVGGVGIQAIQLIKLCGAQAVAVDVDDAKLELAKENGADGAFNSKSPGFLKQLEEVGGFTVLFDTTGISALIESVMFAMEQGAKLILVGYGPGKDLKLPMEWIVLPEREIYGSRGVTNKEVEEMMGLLGRGEIHPVVKTYPLSKLPEIISKVRTSSLVARAVVEP